MPMKWDDGAVAMLCGTIVAILGTDGITQEQKDAIVERMNSAGYDVAWNGISDFYFTKKSIHFYKMPRFEDIKGDLFEAIWRATAPTFGPEQQSAVITHLKAKGIEMTWDAVRAPGLHEDLVAVLLKQDLVSTENWKAVLAGMHEAQYQFTWRGFETIWDDRARSVLLQAVMDVAPPSADQWESIMEKVQESGYSYTPKAAFIVSIINHSLFVVPKIPFKMSGSRITHRWDDKSDRDLLIAVLAELAPTPEQMKNIVQRCHEAGYTFTVSAATQHLQKLKKKDPNGPGAATPSTPKGKKTAASATGSAAKSTSKRGRKPAKKVLDADDDEEDDFDASPSKKTKTEDKAENDAKVDRVKAEHVEEDDAI
ncbi:hypothetical protein MCOR19_007241 [Pyricularia oryzae]|nr:hypothetical protein MCOR19_007241 [Pyricularia oryzae]KAI6530339.1 hypothetical protein MCOR05_007762 [Pyricularia oryzae]KAI6596398.1 hypothetical protein MCOR06_002499 [Pyricularia oryzae]